MTVTCYSAMEARDHAAACDTCSVCGSALPADRDPGAPPDDDGTWAVMGQLRAERTRSGRTRIWHWSVAVMCGDCGLAVVEALDARRRA